MIQQWFNGFFPIPTGYGRGKMTSKKLAEFKNCLAFQNVFAQLLEKALSRYHIEGLPDTCDERTILLSMIWYGGCEFFENSGSVLSLPAVPDGGGINIYGNYDRFWVFSRNGLFNKKVDTYIHGSEEDAFLRKGIGGILGTDKPKGVYVWENPTRYPFIQQIIYYSQAISDTLRTLDVCRVNIKSPYVITAEESIVNTVKEFFRKRDRNEETIISSGIFPADKVNILPITTNEECLTSCCELIEWLYGKYDELCGIDNNSQIDKKGENLISDEVSVNDMRTELGVDVCTAEIQKHLDDCNKLFGTNMKVTKYYEEKEQEAENEAENVSGNENGNGSVPGGDRPDRSGD